VFFLQNWIWIVGKIIHASAVIACHLHWLSCSNRQ
jgi:hypothetical protein